MSRLPPATREELPPDQQQAYDDLTETANKAFGDTFTYKRKDNAFAGPFPFFLAAPEAGTEFLKYFTKIAQIPGLPADAKEVAILATGSHFQAKYELYAHYNVATKKAGLSQDVAKAICEGRKPEGLSEQCGVAYDAAKYLSAKPGPMPQEIWDRCEKALGRQGTVALVHYVGAYAYTCIILNAADVPVPDGNE